VQHFNQLTPAELERLSYLAEEMCEAGQNISKIIRHGYESQDPTKATRGEAGQGIGETAWTNTSPTNRELLENEVGDVLRAIRMMTDASDMRAARLSELRARPAPLKYMHHQICEKEPV
jgi:NTP pyrophosphatase (non-canonical NTP hydrolase)